MSSLKSVEIHEMHLEKGANPGYHFKGAIQWRGGECQFTTSPLAGLNFSGDKPPKSVVNHLMETLAEAESMHLEYDTKLDRWEIIWEE